jgi:nitrogen regulatory protein P-II 1
MKKVEAIIREERLENVKKSLEDKGFVSLTVTEVSGRGEQKGLTLPWRVGEYRVDLLPKLKIEIVIEDKEIENVIEAITEGARTGEIGDGKIFIIPVETAIRVRTGERGNIAVNGNHTNPVKEKVS